MKIATVVTLCFICLPGLLPGLATAQPYTISTDGSEVTDQATGLIWRRCAEGLVGNTCTGTTATYTHEAALQRAALVSSTTAVAWRLPNIKELASLADLSQSNPAIDAITFPATPVGWFWSASPYVGNASYAWFVAFGNGGVGNGDRNLSGYVRLVRAGQ